MKNRSKKKDHRIRAGIARGQNFTIRINGTPVRAYEGETVGAVLAAEGIRRVRLEPRRDDPRGLFCCTGICHGCLVTVDGQPNRQACRTPAAPGQEVLLQEGFGRLDAGLQAPEPGRSTRHTTQVLVVGAGPAGICAALAAARSGAQVLVIDENPQPGGQIYRQLPETFRIEDPASLGIDEADGRSLMEQASDLTDRITIWTDALVWSVFEPRELAVMRKDELVRIRSEALVVASGAYERPYPVPGWTLPGVMTVGGAQTLLKSQRVRPGNRVLFAGTGPLQLVVANQMLDAGIDVAAVAEAASTRIPLRHLPKLFRRIDLMKQGFQYLFRLRKAGVPVLAAHVLKTVEGKEQAERAVLCRVDPRLTPIEDTLKTYEVDTVCIGYGLIPNIWLTQMLDCSHRYDAMVGGWIPDHDVNMQTDRPGIFVAGDGAGVAGVLVARSQGAVAGAYAAAHCRVISTEQADTAAEPYRREMASLRKFRCAMDSIYPIRPELYGGIPEDTVLCRCEGVTAGEIRNAVRNGTMDPNDIKKRTRAGMGYCQGLNCMPTIAMMLAAEWGASPERIPVMTPRPPAKPIPLNLLMGD